MQSVSQSVEEEKEGGTRALHPRPGGNKQAWPPSTARRRLQPFNLEGGGERKRSNHMTGRKKHSALSENSPQQTGEKICGAPAYENRGWRYRLLCHRMLVIAPPLCRQSQHAALFKGSFRSPGSARPPSTHCPPKLMIHVENRSHVTVGSAYHRFVSFGYSDVKRVDSKRVRWEWHGRPWIQCFFR